jgi:DNA polymerase-1
MDVLKLAGIQQAYSPEWEADDVIASLCTTFSAGEAKIIGILSGDRDLLQLVSDTTTLIRPVKGGEFKLETPATIHAEYGIGPTQILDLKALAGDPGDNIPGVHGIGAKTAAKLIQSHGTWRRVVEWASQEQQLPARLGGLRNMAIVEMSADLARLRPDCPLHWLKPDYNRRAFTGEMLRYRFKSLLLDGKLDGLLSLCGR